MVFCTFLEPYLLIAPQQDFPHLHQRSFPIEHYMGVISKVTYEFLQFWGSRIQRLAIKQSLSVTCFFLIIMWVSFDIMLISQAENICSVLLFSVVRELSFA